MLLNEKTGVRPHGVLVVEDNPDDEAMTLRALRLSGLALNVTVAHDGADAVGLLLGDLDSLGLQGPPRLVLLDLKLPKMGGHQVLAALRADARTATVPVVCLTSSDEISDATKAYGNGANSYVRKPIDYDEYLAAIGKTADYWLSVNFWPS